jgi:hypothetical protein
VITCDEFEARFVRPRQGRTLIVGSKVYRTRTDRRPLFPDAVGVDMQAGDGVDVVHDLEEPCDLGTFAHVECRSVLEHAARPWLLAANLERMMTSGSTLFLTVPFVWRVHGYPDDYWRFTIGGVKRLFRNIVWQTLIYSSNESATQVPVKKGSTIMIERTEVYGFGARK